MKEKRKNCWIIPTDQPSRLVKIKDTFFLTTTDDIPGGTFYNIHITSDKKIEKRDWCYSIRDKCINRCENPIPALEEALQYKVIILTTDPTLIADGVQAIDDEFLEWFVKNPTCEFVEVQKWTNYSEVKYKLIIPQEEPKQESHICKYCNTETTQPDDECYAKPKQETLEEAAERLQKDKYGIFISKDADVKGHFVINTAKAAFLSGMTEGANYQAERMYSEEDMEKAFQNGLNRSFDSDFDRWIEQFKKK